jgi:hypothetical protein
MLYAVFFFFFFFFFKNLVTLTISYEDMSLVDTVLVLEIYRIEGISRHYKDGMIKSLAIDINSIDKSLSISCDLDECHHYHLPTTELLSCI